MTHYRTHDLLIGFPDDQPDDNSLNVFIFKERQTTLVIARGAIEEGTSLASTYAQQLKALKHQVKALQCTEPKAVNTGEHNLLEGLEVVIQFMQGTSPSYQYQLVCQVPGVQRMLALTYSKKSLLTDADCDHWRAIKRTLRFA